jgi:hypothetical protein
VTDRYPEGLIAPLKADAGVIKLAPRTPDRVMTLLFGESRDAQVVTADFQSSDPLPIARDTLISADVGDFTRSDGFRFPTAPFNVAAGEPEPISTYAFVTGRTSIRLWMCFDPAGPHRATPGTYVGAVTLDDDALASPRRHDREEPPGKDQKQEQRG